MKICAAQIRPITGDIRRNIENHKKLIHLAVSKRAGLILFPELSLTGYEPSMAKDLVTETDDKRLDDFQRISDTAQITIGVGMPVQSESGICIGMVLFQPHKARQTYSKKYLHPDEEDFFVSGQDSIVVIGDSPAIAPAICYEISVPEHAERAFSKGAAIYMASVAKFANGIEKAVNRLSYIAKSYSMTVLMCNSIGPSDGGDCAGKTSVWNNEGLLAGQLDDIHEGMLIFDSDTQELLEKIIV